MNAFIKEQTINISPFSLLFFCVVKCARYMKNTERASLTLLKMMSCESKT